MGERDGPTEGGDRLNEERDELIVAADQGVELYSRALGVGDGTGETKENRVK